MIIHQEMIKTLIQTKRIDHGNLMAIESEEHSIILDEMFKNTLTPFLFGLFVSFLCYIIEVILFSIPMIFILKNLQNISRAWLNQLFINMFVSKNKILLFYKLGIKITKPDNRRNY